MFVVGFSFAADDRLGIILQNTIEYYILCTIE